MCKYCFKIKRTEEEAVRAVKEFLERHPKTGWTWEDAEVFTVSTDDEGFKNAMIKTFKWCNNYYDFYK